MASALLRTPEMRAQPEEAATGRSAASDLTTLNRWLCLTRLRAVAAVAVFTLVVNWIGTANIAPIPALAICAALAALSACGLATGLSAGAPFTFFLVQTVADLAAITVGIGTSCTGTTALLLRPIFVLVIVPPSLISAPIGLAVAMAASLGHGALTVLEHGASIDTLLSFAFLAPVFSFFLVAQQCFFYGAHLSEKNAALAELADRLRQSQQRLAADGRLSAELAEAARELSATLDSPEPLATASRTIRDCLSADWGAAFVVDQGQTFRVRGVSDAEVPLSELARIDFPLGSWPVAEQLRTERVLVLTDAEAGRVPSLFTAGRTLVTVLLAALYAENDMVGFLAVGYGTRLSAAREWAGHLLAGIAEHATIVLQNARLLEEVREASALKSEFVGAVSHELRSPLNVILGYLDMTLEEELGPLTAEQAAALRRTRHQAIALLEMISALLDLNRFEAGRLPLQRSAVPVDELITEVVEQVPDGWRRPGVAIRSDLTPNLPAMETDRGKLKTVLRNLAHNALKFTERGQVTLGAGLTPAGQIMFTVADTGCGIPPEAIGYVFDMFRQVPGSGGGGVGLGLHIVRRFVEALGGTVGVTSEVGKGTCFTVILPRTAPAVAPDGRPSRTESGVPAAAA